jgi:hypothetical protein
LKWAILIRFSPKKNIHTKKRNSNFRGYQKIKVSMKILVRPFSPPVAPVALFGSKVEKYGQTMLSNKIEVLFVNTLGEHIMTWGTP